MTHPGLGLPAAVAAGVAGAVTGMGPFVLRPCFAPGLSLVDPRFVALVASALAAGGLLATSARRVLCAPHWVTLGEEALEVGRGNRIRGRLEWRRLNEVTPLDLLGAPHLLLANRGERRCVVAFRDARDRATLVERIHARLRALDQPAARIREVELSRRHSARTRPRLSVWAAGACALLVLVFAIERSLGSFPADVERWANVSARVWQGEVHRLLTANFLHEDLLHLATNVLPLLILGSLLQSLLGVRTLLAVLPLSAVAAQLAAALTSDVSVGASGMVYGMLGAFCFAGLARWCELPAVYRVGRLVYLLPPLAMIGVEPLVPHLSVAGHLAGLASGWLVAWLLLRGRSLRVRCLEPAP